MNPKTSYFTRRTFLKTTAGVVGVTLVGGLGCTEDNGASQDENETDTTPKDRAGTMLFSEASIGKLRIKNRLIRSATEEAYNENGSPTDEYIKVMTDLAKGGVGAIVTGVVTLTEADAMGFEMYAFADSFIPRLKEVREEVYKADSQCALFAQIGHTGHRYLGEYRVGPSDVSWPGDVNPMRALSVSEIADIVEAFAQGARRFKEAGWDGVEIHGGHGYLISTFLSPYTNQRTDRYGGSVQGRVQILAEIMEKTRALVGDDFPIIIKVNSDDSGGTEPADFKGGINKAEFLAIAAELDKLGFDGLDVSGNFCSQPGVNDPKDQSYFLDAAEELSISMPVILTGGNRTAELLEDILQTGEIDFFGISRPLVREPDLANKWLTAQSDTTKCISCNLCTNPVSMIAGLRCHQETA